MIENLGALLSDYNGKPEEVLEGNKVSFLSYHIDQIKQGGWSVLLRKFRNLPFALLSIPAVIIVRLLRPFILIRFSPLTSDVIGLMASAIELHLCRRDLENKRTFDIFYHYRKPCNMQLAKMWGRTLHVWNFAAHIDALNRTLPYGEAHTIPFPEMVDIDLDGILPHTPIHLSFTAEEEGIGNECLGRMGVPEGVPFICFHARDQAFKETMHPDKDLSYCTFRNSDIDNQIPMAEEMTRRGYYAIRIGAIVEKSLQTTNPMIIDYSTKYRSDFMDIFLCAKCYFCIGDEDGLNRVPVVFRKPLGNLNMIPISYLHTQGPNDLSILKKLWLRQEKRFLTFRNIFDYGLDTMYATEEYEQAGIVPVDNTPEEITALAVELDERLKGTWQTSEEDEELQSRFWEVFKPSYKERHGLIESRIGADFLHQNKELLI